MKIGILNLFPMRPHVEYMSYITTRLQEKHEINILSCFNDFKTCHYKLYENNKSIKTCLKCKTGSLSLRHKSKYITRIKDLSLDYSDDINSLDEKMILNSIANIRRVEGRNDVKDLVNTKDYERLKKSKLKMSLITRSWVIKEELDLVIIFNGRMDLMDSALKELEQMNIPFLTLESSNTDNGIRVQNGLSCVNHDFFEKEVINWIHFPLSKNQTLEAYSFYYNRIKNTNKYEWRSFKQDEDSNTDLSEFGKFILILPSSMYEFHGLLDEICDWDHPLEGFDKVIKGYQKEGYNVIFRFHPNWSRKVGKFDSDAEQEYINYCKKNNFKYFNSESKVSTRNLIEQSNLVVVNGGSSAIESCLMLKPVINIFPAKYNSSNFVNVYTKGKFIPVHIDTKTLEHRRRLCLRYLYFNNKIYPALQEYIKPINSLDYRYNYKLDFDLKNILENNHHKNNYNGKGSIEFEDEIIKLFDLKNFEELQKLYTNLSESIDFSEYQKIKQSKILNVISLIRNLLPVS